VEIRKDPSSTPKRLVLTWDRVPGADGYRFYSAGVLRSRTLDPSKTKVTFSYGQEPYVVEAFVLSPVDQGHYPATAPPPPPPPPTKRYAPRTHNLGGGGQDPRFCMKPEYGVVDKGTHYKDEMGVKYDKEHGLNTDGLRDRNRMVPGLKGADSMDGLEPCDPYSANGISVPPYPPESFLR
jgi:hypothetical protein